MTQKKSTKPKAQWSEEEVDVLLTYLQSQVAKIAVTTFKDETFNEAAQKITEHHAKKGLQNQGAAKDMAQCRGKWRSLKEVYTAIDTYRRSQSGCHWDNINGANIRGTQKQRNSSGTSISKLAIQTSGSSSLAIQPSESLSASGLEAAVVPQVGWDQIKSAAGSSMNMPPPPSSVTPSTTSKRTHSDMVSSASATQSMASPMAPPNVDKKPSLHMSASNTDENETRVSEERVQAMNFMQEEDDISDDEQITLMNVFSRSPSICSIYLAAKPEKRVRYLKPVLAQAARGEFEICVIVVLAPIILVDVLDILRILVKV
ncbi:hypothetical protein DFJ58DRAFT_837080 [Suillus subalutaceus]|uniref:uncharacterized protein n=1 Tax=Suillus subalutaceus TaxID=48586 RepID=UPI001B865B9F|nr:uncharacterized protein DFJ58DRAFT_837080 [Suillus subalutaceus]KAG1871759.1 hypothetical protein DFJ58DRAFT_837080 [Suillus subalutaceus]